jgi:hypothetical protein
MNNTEVLHIGAELNSYRAQFNYLNDAGDHKWTIINDQAMIDGQPAGYSLGVTELAEINGVVWQENSAGKWWAWNPVYQVWDGGNGLPNPLPADFVSGVLNADQGGYLVESDHVWSIANGQVYENGQPAGYSANVVKLAIVGPDVWQENSSGFWWKWNAQSGAWDGGGGLPSPLPFGAGQTNTNNGGAWNDSGSWTFGTPDNWSQQTVLLNGAVTAPQYDFVAGLHIRMASNTWFEPGPGWDLNSDADLYSNTTSNDGSGVDLHTIFQVAGTIYNYGHMGVIAGPVPLAPVNTLHYEIHNGTLVNGGVLDSWGAKANFEIEAHNQYPGFSGSLINNGVVNVRDGAHMTLDTMVKGDGQFNVQGGSRLTLSGPDDGGNFLLAGGSVLEFAKPTFIHGNDPAMQFGGAITLGDLYEQVKLDGVSGYFADVSHPASTTTHLTVEDASHGAIASLNFAGNLDASQFFLTRSGGDTHIGYGHAVS